MYDTNLVNDIRILAKKTAKDSVFRDLFEKPQYLFQLYQALHPEDKGASEKDIGIVTIKNVLLDQMYNDLGFTVGNRLLILVEAQSTWSINIIIRSLMYLAQTWQEHIESTKQNIYGSKRLELPFPELYVIYTGSRKKKKEWISLSEEFFQGNTDFINVKVKVLYGEAKEDIIGQYVGFTRVYNGQVKKYGRTREAVLETIRICKDNNILKGYLESREKEVVDIMMTLFNDEYILQTYLEEETKKAARKGQEEGRKEGELKKARETALKLAQIGTLPEVISNLVDVDLDTVNQWLSGSPSES